MRYNLVNLPEHLLRRERGLCWRSSRGNLLVDAGSTSIRIRAGFPLKVALQIELCSYRVWE